MRHEQPIVHQEGEAEGNEELRRQLEDQTFWERFSSSQVARLARRLALLTLFMGAGMAAHGAELHPEDKNDLDKSTLAAKGVEDRLLALSKSTGEFVRLDWKRVDYGDTSKVFERGFVGTDGKRVQVKAGAYKDPQTGEIIGSTYYWCDDDNDGRADRLVVFKGEGDAQVDSVALGDFDKDFGATVAEAGKAVEGSGPASQRMVYARDGVVWRAVKFGDDKVKELRPEQATGMQELFESHLVNGVDKVEKGGTTY